VPLGTAKSRIRLGLAKLREECEAALGTAAAGIGAGIAGELAGEPAGTAAAA
jgi:hypothetical protein